MNFPADILRPNVVTNCRRLRRYLHTAAMVVCLLNLGAWSTALQAAVAPAIQAISPNSGSSLGGTSVTVTGANFTAGATLSIGGNPAINVTVVDANTITATTPAIATAGPADVVVTNPDSQTATLPASRIPNAGFELGAANWKLTGTGGTATAVSNAANAHSGTSYAELTVSAGQKANFVVADSAGNPAFLPVQAGDVVDFGGWANRIGGDGTANFSLTVFDTSKANPIYLSPVPIDAGPGGWTFQTRRYTIPATGAFIRIYAQLFGTTVAGTVRFDDALLSGGFLFTTPTTPAPTVSSVLPPTVGTTGGDAVTINGTNFVTGAAVSFGGIPAASANVSNATTITGVTPARASGTVDLSVTNPDGQSGTLTSAITFSAPTNPAPSIASISPNNGAATGGTTVTVTGANFAPGATVSFDGITAFATVTNSTTIVATAPAHVGGNVDVTVTNPDNQAGTLPANRLRNSGYELGAAGWAVGGTGGTATVVNNSVNAHLGAQYVEQTAAVGEHPTFLNADPNNVGMYFPVAAGDILDFSGWAFRVAGDGVGKYSLAVLDSAKLNPTFVSPSPANVTGTAWTQQSFRYAVPSGKAFVRFYSEVLNPTVATTIRFDDAFLTGGFVYTGPNPAPTISSISPNSGASTASTPVAITGTMFSAGATVTIGGLNCGGAAVTGTTQITCTAPPNTAGSFDVIVTNPDAQSATLASGFTYTASTAPSILGVIPNAGADTGGDSITIQGTNFTLGAQVMFDTFAASNVVVVDPNNISVTTPSHTAGMSNVTVKNAGGQSATSAGVFSFVSSATSSASVASVTPIAGPTLGGTAVTIRGTGFVTGATVSIGGKAATAVAVVNSTTITATTAANSVGMAAVSVTSGGATATLPGMRNPALSPGFESGTSGWKLSGTGTAVIKTAAASAHSGNNYLEMTSGAGLHPQDFALDSTGNAYFAVKPGDAVTFGGWIKRVSGDGTAKFTLEVTDANKANPNYISTFPANVTATTWTKQQWTYFVPGGKAFVRIFAEISGSDQPTVVDYDDMILQLPSGYRYKYSIPAGNTSLNSKIQHVVLFVQENRSLDTYFGTLGQYFLKRNPSTTATFDGLHPNASNIDPNITNLDRSNAAIHPFRVITSCFDSLNPGWNEAHRDVDGGKMDMFMKNSAYVTTNDPNGRRAMGYHDQTMLNYYYEVAFQYGTSDRWFSSLLSGTFPNRMYITAGTSLGNWGNSPPVVVPQGGWLAETLYDRLTQKGVSWKYYYQDPNTVEIKNWTTFTRDASRVVPLTQYYTDLANGALPQVVFIERGFDDEHPGKNFQPGQQLGKKVIDALMASSAWSSSIYIQTYDEGGGLYDHVPPASVVLPDNIPPSISSTDFQAAFNQTGFRVPLLVVSPYAKANFVSHKPREFTSMLKLIETRFGLEPLTARDNAADDMTEFFDFVSAPRLIKPALPTPVTNILCNYAKGDGQ